MESIERALQSLFLPEYSDLQKIFGAVLAKRGRQREPDCFIFRHLALNGTHELAELNKDSGIYVRELGLEEAQRRCRDEVMGLVKRSPREFNSRCADFWAEMAAVRELSKGGFHHFRSIKREHGKGTSDYHACREQARAYIEVKNLHANETLFDSFIREIREAYERMPSAYAFHLVVNFAYDDPPTREQEGIVRDFICGIKNRKPPFHETLDLVNDMATIDVTVGEGTVVLVRGVGGGRPQPVDEAWLLRKVRAKAEEARGQIPDGDHLKVFVINVDSTTAMLSSDFIRMAEQEILDVFEGNVTPYVLHFRHWAQIESN